MANVDGEKRPAQILRDAAGVIRERGHCKGAYYNGRGVCAIGALRVAATGSPFTTFTDEDDLVFGSESTLARTLGLRSGTTVSAWNDAPERTAEEVIAALESAAASLESA